MGPGRSLSKHTLDPPYTTRQNFMRNVLLGVSLWMGHVGLGLFCHVVLTIFWPGRHLETD
jgi:hypothetical protein